MKNFIVAFSVFMMWAILGMWYYSCVIKEVCEDNAITEQQINENRKPISDDAQHVSENEPEDAKQLRQIIVTDSLNVIDSGLNTIFSYPLAPEIKINSPVVEIPQTTTIFVSDVANHLKNNPETQLIVYGAYDENEFTSSEIKNHGLTRAAYIQDLIVEEGINAGRITVKSIRADLNFIQNENFQGGILLQIKNYDELEEDDTSVSEDERYNKTLYTNFDQDTFRPDQDVAEYATRLKEYLDEHPSKRVTITGHTDSVGEAEANEWIGMERAKSVRDYLKTQGIEEYKLQAVTKGETEPIAENTTREGRAKNRRIEIQIN